MKHTIEELLFASAVREIMDKRRIAHCRDMTNEQRIAYANEPADELIEDVVLELERIAVVISDVRSRQKAVSQ